MLECLCWWSCEGHNDISLIALLDFLWHDLVNMPMDFFPPNMGQGESCLHRSDEDQLAKTEGSCDI